jgi:hypothetical protein
VRFSPFAASSLKQMMGVAIEGSLPFINVSRRLEFRRSRGLRQIAATRHPRTFHPPKPIQA